MAALNAKRWISTILRKDKGLWLVYAEDNSGGLNRLLNNTYGISQLTEHLRSQSFIVRAKLYCKRLPIQNKRPPYCFWYVSIRSGSKWPMIGPRPCAYARSYVDPVFCSQSYDISISTSARRTNLSVFLVLLYMLMLMSTQFSLAYTFACAYAYAYAPVKLYMCSVLFLQL